MLLWLDSVPAWYWLGEEPFSSPISKLINQKQLTQAKQIRYTRI